MNGAPKRILPAPVKAAAVAFLRGVVCEAALMRRPTFPGFDGPVSLHLLMSHATRQMGLLALTSFEWETRRRWRTFIHDDGSLTCDDVRKIARVAPHAEVVLRSGADAAMQSRLAGLPRSLANRARHNWFLKFFDCAHFAPYDHYIVLDTDVIFYRCPEEILNWAGVLPDRCHFMKDARETYASPRDIIRERTGLELWDAVNSGICLMPKTAANFGLAEEFLGQFADDAKHYIFLEQTLFAIAGAALGSGGTLPETYEISWNIRRRPDGVARHYVGIIKHDLLYAEGGTTLLLRLPFRRNAA